MSRARSKASARRLHSFVRQRFETDCVLTTKAGCEAARHAHGLDEFKAGALRETLQFLLRKSVRIARKLGDREQTSGPQHVCDRHQTSLRVRSFAKYCHEERDIESARLKW